MAEGNTAKLPEQEDEKSAKANAASVAPDPAGPSSSGSDAKPKDIWDKAQIISGFLASVVIATVGLEINSSIQRAQIKASEESANAQIQITDRNNKAQLALSQQTAEIQTHIQESTLTSQLVEHLASDSPLKKQIAIVALRRSVPPEMYQDVITIVVRSDANPEVRKTALQQASTLQAVNPSVVQAINDAANDASRPGEERKIATETVEQFGLRSITPRNTFVLYSSGSNQLSFEDPRVKGGVFTHFLIEGLSGGASSKDGSIRLSQLAQYVRVRVREDTKGDQEPGFSASLSTASDDPVILGSGLRFAKTVVIAAGNSRYVNPHIPQLVGGASDAEKVAEFFRQHGADVVLIKDSTRTYFLDTFSRALQDVDEKTLLIFYYSGKALVDPGGTFWLLPVDADPAALSTTALSTSDINHDLKNASAALNVLFIDTAFSGSLVATSTNTKGSAG